ncbi:unnamed protein product [Cladocopium goreaui]|uniref:Protein kinase domain-containing protein n=1 Tax=Cladocopium goreaui TaxID=2562237 RepID=A0A9P1FMR3_9DINO|nr:unnamed protein product [Cladocopium goreaui]
MYADGNEQVRLDIRALSGKQILEVSIARNSTGEELHRLVNEEGDSLAFQWQLVHRNAPLKMGPLEFTDGEVIVATLQPCLNSLDLEARSFCMLSIAELLSIACDEVHPLKCGEFRLPKCYQKVADASFGKDCTVQAHMSRTLQMQTQVFLRKVPGNFHVAENAFNEYSFLKKASNVNVIRMWDAFIATDGRGLGADALSVKASQPFVLLRIGRGESKECEVVTVFETMDVTLEKFLKDFGRLGDLNYCDYFLCNVAMGLHYIHAAGVAHGDICPANVWLNRNDDVKLAGFQHLHPADPAPPDSSAEFFDFATKSIQYAAPEVLRKESFGGAQADLFGLGCILVDFLLKRIHRLAPWIQELSEEGQSV